MHRRITVRFSLAVCLFLIAAALLAPHPLLADPRVGPDLPIYIGDNIQQLPAVAYNSQHDEYLVVWHNGWAGGDIYARRVSGGGEILSSFPVSEGPYSRVGPAVAYDPGHQRYLVVWAYDVFGNGTDWDLYGRFIPWNGPDPVVGSFSISTTGDHEWAPQVVYNAHPNVDEFMVVWVTYGAPASISACRVAADGSGFPGGAFTVASHITEHRTSPDLAYNLARNEYLVVSGSDTGNILGQRLRWDGVLLGGEIGIAGWPSSEERPAVAACHTANQYLVVWQALVGTAPNQHWDIYGRYVAGDGSAENVEHIYGTTANDAEPDVACNPQAGHYLVTWQEQYSNPTGPYGISGRLVHTDKSLGARFGIVGPYAGTNRANPAVAAGRPGYLVAWEHDRYGTGWVDIHGRLVWPAVIYVPLVVRQ